MIDYGQTTLCFAILMKYKTCPAIFTGIMILLIISFFSELKADEKDRILPDFKLPGVDGRYYTQKDFESYRLTAVVFLSNHCRVSQLFQTQIIEINKRVRNEGIAIFAVSPNYAPAILPDELAYSDLGDSYEEMKKRALRLNYNFPYLYDGENQAFTKLVGATITPSVYIYNKQKKLIYVGRIGNHDTVENINTSDLFNILKDSEPNSNENIKRKKVFGTSIKTKDDNFLAEQVRKRYADEKIRLVSADSRKLKFYANHLTQKPKLFYVWQMSDENSRENLIKLSSLYKIFRKRGFKLITVAIGEENQREKIVQILNQAQLSTTNFISQGHEIGPLSALLPNTIEKTTPFYRLISSGGTPLLGGHGDVIYDELRMEVLRALND